MDLVEAARHIDEDLLIAIAVRVEEIAVGRLAVGGDERVRRHLDAVQISGPHALLGADLVLNAEEGKQVDPRGGRGLAVGQLDNERFALAILDVIDLVETAVVTAIGVADDADAQVVVEEQATRQFVAVLVEGNDINIVAVNKELVVLDLDTDMLGRMDDRVGRVLVVADRLGAGAVRVDEPDFQHTLLGGDGQDAGCRIEGPVIGTTTGAD